MLKNQVHRHPEQAHPEQGQMTYDDVNSMDHTLRTGMLNELLRKQLTPNPPVSQNQPIEQQGQRKAGLLSTAVNAVNELLNNPVFDRTKVHTSLSELFHQQKEIYLKTNIDESLRKRQFISHCGLVMSPDNCITTQLDDIRVRAFIRGIDAALKEKLPGKNDPIHVVYPACGPFAPLLMPLIAYYRENNIYSESQLQVTLIDIQPGAVQSLEALITEMQIGDYIRQVCCMDATEYYSEQADIDILVLEAMQHGFSREGHFMIARHFVSMLAGDGCIIPEKVKVTAILNSAQQEYVEQWRDAEELSEVKMDSQIKSERIILGEVMSLTRESLSNLKERILDHNTRLIECGKVFIPDIKENASEQTLLLCTRMETYAGELIGEYDSGITHPLPDQQVCVNFIPREERPGDLILKSGDGIRFYYRLNGLPGFFAASAEGEANHD